MPDSIASSLADSDGVAEARARWLLLTHHLPPEPAYFRVKVRRRLERVGAVPLKNSVYVLPASHETLEDFQWLLQEILREGGEATLSEASFLDGTTDRRLVEQFRETREADYRALTQAARGLLAEGPDAGQGRAAFAAKIQRLSRRLEEVNEVDFFEAEGRVEAERAVDELRLAGAGYRGSAEADRESQAERVGSGRLWVTRRGVKVDRIASAWLIRRFIDPRARFLFVEAQAYKPTDGDLRFDMFEGEFTHVGDACTFETLLDRFGLTDPALRSLAQIIHDIDCKDEKFDRPEAPGVAGLVNGIVRRHAGDEERLERGAAILDDLYEHFRKPGA